MTDRDNIVCPVPHAPPSVITIAHGGGGRLMQRLIDEVFRAAFHANAVDAQHDAAVLCQANGPLAFTTDAFVVSPLFFPGGNIGHLSVCGTVNDLAMAGARPLALSAAFILEEGLSFETLRKVVHAMQTEAARLPVRIVTGDTKVVERGKGDGIYITTTGIGLGPVDRTIDPSAVREGDAILVSGDVGRHGVAIMAAREGLGLETTIQSDTQSLWPAVEALLAANIDIHCMRDCTRGGLAAALLEVIETAGVGAEVVEQAIPVNEVVRGACELLGLEPMHVANEGRFVIFLAQDDAERALAILAQHAEDTAPARIGTVTHEHGQVTVVGALGARRILDRPSGEQLPRIC